MELDGDPQGKRPKKVTEPCGPQTSAIPPAEMHSFVNPAPRSGLTASQAERLGDRNKWGVLRVFLSASRQWQFRTDVQSYLELFDYDEERADLNSLTKFAKSMYQAFPFQEDNFNVNGLMNPLMVDEALRVQSHGFRDLEDWTFETHERFFAALMHMIDFVRDCVCTAIGDPKRFLYEFGSEELNGFFQSIVEQTHPSSYDGMERLPDLPEKSMLFPVLMCLATYDCDVFASEEGEDHWAEIQYRTSPNIQNQKRFRNIIETLIRGLPATNWSADDMDKIAMLFIDVLEGLKGCLDVLTLKVCHPGLPTARDIRNNCVIKNRIFDTHFKIFRKTWEVAICNNYVMFGQHEGGWGRNPLNSDDEGTRRRVYEILHMTDHPENFNVDNLDYEYLYGVFLSMFKREGYMKKPTPVTANNKKVTDMDLHKLIQTQKFYFDESGSLRSQNGRNIHDIVLDDQCQQECKAANGKGLRFVLQKFGFNRYSPISWLFQQIGMKDGKSEEIMGKIIHYLNSQDTGNELPEIKTSRMWVAHDGAITPVPLEFLKPNIHDPNEFSNLDMKSFFSENTKGGLFDYKRIVYPVSPPSNDYGVINLNNCNEDIAIKQTFGMSEFKFHFETKDSNMGFCAFRFHTKRVEMPYIYGRYTAAQLAAIVSRNLGVCYVAAEFFTKFRKLLGSNSFLDWKELSRHAATYTSQTCGILRFFLQPATVVPHHLHERLEISHECSSIDPEAIFHIFAWALSNTDKKWKLSVRVAEARLYLCLLHNPSKSHKDEITISSVPCAGAQTLQMPGFWCEACKFHCQMYGDVANEEKLKSLHYGILQDPDGQDKEKIHTRIVLSLQSHFLHAGAIWLATHLDGFDSQEIRNFAESRIPHKTMLLLKECSMVGGLLGTLVFDVAKWRQERPSVDDPLFLNQLVLKEECGLNNRCVMVADRFTKRAVSPITEGRQFESLIDFDQIEYESMWNEKDRGGFDSLRRNQKLIHQMHETIDNSIIRDAGWNDCVRCLEEASSMLASEPLSCKFSKPEFPERIVAIGSLGADKINREYAMNCLQTLRHVGGYETMACALVAYEMRYFYLNSTFPHDLKISQEYANDFDIFIQHTHNGQNTVVARLGNHEFVEDPYLVIPEVAWRKVWAHVPPHHLDIRAAEHIYDFVDFECCKEIHGLQDKDFEGLQSYLRIHTSDSRPVFGKDWNDLSNTDLPVKDFPTYLRGEMLDAVGCVGVYWRGEERRPWITDQFMTAQLPQNTGRYRAFGMKMFINQGSQSENRRPTGEYFFNPALEGALKHKANIFQKNVLIGNTFDSNRVGTLPQIYGVCSEGLRGPKTFKIRFSWPSHMHLLDEIVNATMQPQMVDYRHEEYLTFHMIKAVMGRAHFGLKIDDWQTAVRLWGKAECGKSKLVEFLAECYPKDLILMRDQMDARFGPSEYNRKCMAIQADCPDPNDSKNQLNSATDKKLITGEGFMADVKNSSPIDVTFQGSIFDVSNFGMYKGSSDAEFRRAFSVHFSRGLEQTDKARCPYHSSLPTSYHCNLIAHCAAYHQVLFALSGIKGGGIFKVGQQNPLNSKGNNMMGSEVSNPLCSAYLKDSKIKLQKATQNQSPDFWKDMLKEIGREESQTWRFVESFYNKDEADSYTWGDLFDTLCWGVDDIMENRNTRFLNSLPLWDTQLNGPLEWMVQGEVCHHPSGLVEPGSLEKRVFVYYEPCTAEYYKDENANLFRSERDADINFMVASLPQTCDELIMQELMRIISNISINTNVFRTLVSKYFVERKTYTKINSSKAFNETDLNIMKQLFERLVPCYNLIVKKEGRRFQNFRDNEKDVLFSTLAWMHNHPECKGMHSYEIHFPARVPKRDPFVYASQYVPDKFQTGIPEDSSNEPDWRFSKEMEGSTLPEMFCTLMSRLFLTHVEVMNKMSDTGVELSAAEVAKVGETESGWKRDMVQIQTGLGITSIFFTNIVLQKKQDNDALLRAEKAVNGKFFGATGKKRKTPAR